MNTQTNGNHVIDPQSTRPFGSGSTDDSGLLPVDLLDSGLSRSKGAGASENPEAVPAVGGAHRLSDLITRQRDRHGNRLPWFYSHSVPVIDDVPLKETALAGAIAEIQAELPIEGAELEHYYERVLRPAVRRTLAVQDAEEARLAAFNQKAETLSGQLDAEDLRVNQADREALAKVEEALMPAHLEAGECVAALGRGYDLENPSPDCVLQHRPHDAAALAAELRLPWTPADAAAKMSSLAGGFTTLVIGMMIGLSLGLLSGYVPTGNWFLRPVPLGFFLCTGVAAAIAGKYAIRHSARVAAQRYWIEAHPRNWGFFAVVSVLVTATVVAIDSFVEREGLMASVRMQELARSLSASHGGEVGSREGLYFLMAILLTFGYAVNAYWEGYLCGRYDACLNRIKHEQELRIRAEEQAHRALPQVHAALNKVARVQRLLQEGRMLQARIAERTQHLNAQRLQPLEELPVEACLRKQDAGDQSNGTMEIWNARFQAAKHRCEGGGGLRMIVRYLLFGAARARKRHREQKRKIR